MFVYQRIVIAQHERGLLFRNRSFAALLEPGVYNFFDPLRRLTVERYDLTRPEFEHPLIDVLLKEQPALCERCFQRIELSEDEAGLVYKNGKLSAVLAPNTRQLYWRAPIEVRVETVALADDCRVPEPAAKRLRDTRTGAEPIATQGCVFISRIGDQQLGLLLIDGELKQVLQPGVHVFWRFQRSVEVQLVDTRLLALEVSGQEILSKDKVSLRLNLAASYRIVDPVQLRATVPDVRDFLYRELQFALRHAVGTRTLDELLADKTRLDAMIRERIVEVAQAHGVDINSVGVKDVILPGDMKEILNQVVAAEKAAQANVIRRREETAATRSLLNTAKLMDENPILLRLKELEALERVTDKIERLTVFGGLEGVLQELVTLRPPKQA